jgi:hypothetical protein
MTTGIEQRPVADGLFEGPLWTYTVQSFPPKSPPYTGAFEPYGVGYVERAGEEAANLLPHALLLRCQAELHLSRSPSTFCPPR